MPNIMLVEDIPNRHCFIIVGIQSASSLLVAIADCFLVRLKDLYVKSPYFITWLYVFLSIGLTLMLDAK